MKRKLLLIPFVIIMTKGYSQVGINTNDPKTTFDVSVKRNSSGTITDNTENYGVTLPTLSRLELTQNTAVYSNAQKGAMIYINDVSGGDVLDTRVNVNSVGYYYFNGSIWKKLESIVSNTINISTIVDPNILGYTPSATATASSAGIPAIANATVTKLSTGTYGEHSYAAYGTDKVITWYEAYNAAKELGGYLATFTDDNEWAYVEDNMITPQAHFDTYGGWIGFARFTWNAGSGLTPPVEMKWITGEQPNHDYAAGGTVAVRKSNWFNTNEPQGGTQGFVYFVRTGTARTLNGHTSTHLWSDVAANDTAQGIRGFIVEFKQ